MITSWLGKVFVYRPSGIDSNATFETRRARCGEMSAGRANVGSVLSDRHDRGSDERPGAMTSMWSSPERRTERCAGCERTFEQPPSRGALLLAMATA